MQNEIGPHGGGNEFERIKFLDDKGVERWSARDYQVILTYDQWKNFEQCIDRAKVTCQTKGFDVAHHFAESGKVMPKGRWGTTTVDDYHLSRYACYLTAMECDSSKPVVADAKTYFAISTFENEQRKAVEQRLPANYVDALRQLADEVERNQALEAQKSALQGRVLELAPKAEFCDRVTESVNAISIGKFAKVLDVGPNIFFAWLREQEILMDGGPNHNLPYQHYIDEGYFKVREGSYARKSGEHTYLKTLVTGKGQAFLSKRWGKEHAVQTRLEA